MRRSTYGATWIDPEELAYNTPNGGPHGSNRRAFARFADGYCRIVTCGVPDTFFSIPAIGRVAGKYVRGFIMLSSGGEEWIFHAERADAALRKAGAGGVRT